MLKAKSTKLSCLILLVLFESLSLLGSSVAMIAEKLQYPNKKYSGSKLLIPGPVPVPPEVLAALNEQPESHTAPSFRKKFARSLKNFRLLTGGDESTQPFILAGSGGLGWDLVSSSFATKNPEHFDPENTASLKPSESWRKRALVLNTGFFSDRMKRALIGYGWTVDEIKFECRDSINGDITGYLTKQLESLSKKSEENEMKEEGRRYSMVCVTQVDTSTAILNDIELVSKWMTDTFGDNRPLLMVDGVCATAGERMEFSKWSVDILFTASQKAVSLPAGLCLMILSESALSLMSESRGTVVTAEEDSGTDTQFVPHGFYTDLNDWKLIMEKYSNEEPCYYSTPATGLVSALDVGLELILGGNADDSWKAMELVFLRHEILAKAFRDTVNGVLLLELTAKSQGGGDLSVGRANTLSGFLLPESVKSVSEFVGYCYKQYGFTFSGGLGGSHSIRIGHMGYAANFPSLFAECIVCLDEALQHFGVTGVEKENRESPVSEFYRRIDEELEKNNISFEQLFPLELVSDDGGSKMDEESSESSKVRSQDSPFYLNSEFIPLLMVSAVIAFKVFSQNKKVGKSD